MIKNLFFFCVLSLLSFQLEAQSTIVVANKLNSNSLEADEFVGIDNLGYCYYLKDTVFYKQKGIEIWQYQNVGLGEITKIDIINPLRIVVFYENFNKVIFLDNQLNEISTVDFSIASDAIVARNVGMCGQNSVWVFNAINQQLGLFNYETRQYRALNQPLKGTFIYYQTDFNSFIWVDEKFAVYRCDVFGKREFLHTTHPFDLFQYVSNKGALIVLNDKLFFIADKSQSVYQIQISVKSIKKFSYQDNILTIFTGKEISSYNLNLP